ncbi:AAA family ATPase, partial [Candidatus Uhrbacteria bacterium]|nr:AAA family ATPase [Candidatus Uhrbacteria bacterium]
MFSCQKCDAQSPKWSGRCLECGAWGTLVEDVPSSVHQKTESKRGPARESVRLSLAKEGDASALRFPTGIGEVDRVIGGGLVQGSLVLLSGEPGIGKSTLVAMMAVSIAGRESGGGRMTRTSIPSLSTLHSPLSLPPLPPSHLLYVSGEESAGQLADRFARLGMKADSDIRFLEAMPIEEVVATVEKEKPRVAILDSVQTFPAATIEGGAGTATTVRYVANILLELAKKSGVT